MKLAMKLLAAAALAGALATAQTSALAADEYNTSTGTTVAGEGVALRGHDVVALATGLEVEDGFAKHTHVFDGVAYYFASEATMKRFAANPVAYIPQFGGFCALGVALGKKVDAAPRYADLVDGKLYVFLNAAVFEKYQEDKAGVIANAHQNWPGMHHRSVEEVNGL